jgi:hypothetical protein|nr:MAG TPA: hypothetical protein [Caudoviricetes sp.]
MIFSIPVWVLWTIGLIIGIPAIVFAGWNIWYFDIERLKQ